MKLCVIGAGAAGLCAAKHGIDFGFEVTVFEKIREVGGVWAYAGELDTSLTTISLPREVMGYPDFSFPEQKNSYITSRDASKFYRSYADHFELIKLIKFEHLIEQVRPILDEKWDILVQDMTTRKFESIIFDAVMVCNGHNTSISLPKIEGLEKFKGKLIYSHDYHKAEDFEDESFLVISVGPSGTYHVVEVTNIDKHVGSVIQKPGIKTILENGVQFVNGAYQDCSVIMYCIGSNYAFPFLSVDCGISCIDNFINPLYKEVLNISYPSMGFIGIQKFVTPNQLFDLQVRFALTFMSGRKQLPTKSEMLEDSEKENAERLLVTGSGKNITHYLGSEFLQKYFTDIATTAETAPIKPVIAKMFAFSIHNLIHETETFRNVVFKVIDDESFTVETLK